MKDIKIQLNTEVWKEGNIYISYVSQLDLSSCGNTVDEAKKNIKEAVELFFEETQKMGTYQNILKEAGFSSHNKEWKAPEIISFEKMNFAF